MKTAMSQMYNEIESLRDNFPGVGFDEEFIRGFNKAFQIALLICKDIGIQTEKQQIIEAYESGQDSAYSESINYYTSTFETNKETLK